MVSRIILASLLLMLGIAFVRFGAGETRQVVGGAESAVVFTGAYERIDAGLDLLNAGIVHRVFISGANPEAGIRVNDFRRQFEAKHPNLRSMLECCIEFGELAQTTLQNALETRCWAEQGGHAGPIALITSELHMPRARLALSSALPNVEIRTYPVLEDQPQQQALRTKMLEFSKYLLTLGLIGLPSAFIPRHLLGAFETCPSNLSPNSVDQSLRHPGAR